MLPQDFFLLSVRLSSSTPCYLWRIWLADSPSQNKAWSSLKRLNHTALMSLLSFRFNKTNLRYMNYKKMISSSINLFNNRFLTPNTAFCRQDCCFLAICSLPAISWALISIFWLKNNFVCPNHSPRLGSRWFHPPYDINGITRHWTTNNVNIST